ncbi:MAG: Uma2 family endonuclease [Bacteroidota bacterium]
MGEPAISSSSYSYEAYLAVEADTDLKYEYHDGFIVAMAGGTPEHGRIAANLLRSLGNALIAKNSPCNLYSSDVKIHVATSNRSFYPDVSMVCGPEERSEKDSKAITNPSLLIEILSDSTEAKDRGLKFQQYRMLPSLREYVLVSQKEAIVESFFRKEDGYWQILTAVGLDASISFPSAGVKVALSDIYRGLELESAPESE